MKYRWLGHLIMNSVARVALGSNKAIANRELRNRPGKWRTLRARASLGFNLTRSTKESEARPIAELRENLGRNNRLTIRG